MTARMLCDAGDRLGESPVWDHRFGRLLWIDIERGMVHSWCKDQGQTDLLRTEGWIGVLALAGAADLLLGAALGLVRWSPDTGEPVLIADPIAGRKLRFNDGRVDAAGRLWVGLMTLDPSRYDEPLGMLLRCDADGRTAIMEEGLTIPNGMDWSPDGKTFYLTDTMRRRIYAYDFDCQRGSLMNRRIFAEMNENTGRPDGLVVDGEGSVWSMSFREGCVQRYSRHGELIGKLALPVSTTTAIAFGGAELKQAFVTSAASYVPGQEQAGAVFVMDTPVPGIAGHVFGMDR